jgi:hypothetical protein
MLSGARPDGDVDMVNAIGRNGLSVAFDKLYTAIQTGVPDGAENNPPDICDAQALRDRRVLHADRAPDRPGDL